MATIDQERIVVRSVDIDIIDDETFGDVGVISYTWALGDLPGVMKRQA